MEVSKILTILAYSLLFIAIISFVFAIMYHYHFYWLSALSIYFFSFLGGFSIGQITVGLTFIPLILAIGHSFQWIKSQTQGLILMAAGCLIGLLSVVFIGNYIFYRSEEHTSELQSRGHL